MFDAAAHLTQQELVASLATHLPWGIHGEPPNSDNETLIVQRNFVVNYDTDLNTPTWVAYRLTAADIDEDAPDHVTRIDCFRDFPQVGPPPEDAPPHCSDYDNDSFDRGHPDLPIDRHLPNLELGIKQLLGDGQFLEGRLGAELVLELLVGQVLTGLDIGREAGAQDPPTRKLGLEVASGAFLLPLKSLRRSFNELATGELPARRLDLRQKAIQARIECRSDSPP